MQKKAEKQLTILFFLLFENGTKKIKDIFSKEGKKEEFFRKISSSLIQTETQNLTQTENTSVQIRYQG